MTTLTVTVLEGTWEEILEHASDLTGKRLLVTVLPGESADAQPADALRPENRRMLDVLDDMMRHPLPEQEQVIAGEFEQFRREHPFRLRHPDEFE